MRRWWILNPILVLINVLAVIPHARPLPLDQKLGASSNGTEEARTSLSAVAITAEAVEQPPTPVVVPLTPIAPDEAEFATSKTPVERGTDEAVISTVPVVVVVDTGTAEDAVTSVKDVRDTTDLLDVDLDGEGEGDEGEFEEDVAAASRQEPSLSLVEKDRDERATGAQIRTGANKHTTQHESQSPIFPKKLNAEPKKSSTMKNNNPGVPKPGAASTPQKNKEEPTKIKLKELTAAPLAHTKNKGQQSSNKAGSEKNVQNVSSTKPLNNPRPKEPQVTQAAPALSVNKVPEVAEATGKEEKGNNKGSVINKPGSPQVSSPATPPSGTGTGISGGIAKPEGDKKGGTNAENDKGNSNGAGAGAGAPSASTKVAGSSSDTNKGGEKDTQLQAGNSGQATGSTASTKDSGNKGPTVVVGATETSAQSARPSTPVSPPLVPQPEPVHPVSVPIPPYYLPQYLAASSYPVVNPPNYYGKPAQPPLPQPYAYQPDYSHYPMYSPPVSVYSPNPGYRPAAPYGYPPTNLAVYSPAQPPPPPPPQPATYSQQKQYRPTSYREEPPATRGSSYSSNPPRRNNYPPITQPKYRPTPYKPSASPTRTYKKVEEPVPNRRNPYPPRGQQYRPYKKPSTPTPTYTLKPGNQYKPKIYTSGPYEKPSPVYVPPVNRRQPQAKPMYKPDADQYIKPAENPYTTDDDDDNKSGDTGNIYGYEPYETPKPKKPSMPLKKKIVYPTPVAKPYDERRPYGEDRPAETEEYQEKEHRKTVPHGRPSSPYQDRQPEYRPTYAGEDEDEPYSTKTYPATPYERDPYAQENEPEAPTYPDGNHEAPLYGEPEPASYAYPAAAPRRQRPPKQYSPNRYDHRPPAPTPYGEKETYEEDEHQGDPYGESDGPEHLAPEEDDGYARPGRPYRDDEKQEGDGYETEAESPPEPEYTETESYRPPYGENRYRPRARSDYIDEGEPASAYDEPTYDTIPSPDNYFEAEQDATTYDPQEQYGHAEEDPRPIYNYEEDQSPAADEEEDGEAGYPGEVPYGQVEQIEAHEMERYEQYGEVEQNQYDEPEEGGQDEYSSSGRSLVEAPASSSTVITTQNTDDPGGVIAGNIG